MNMRSMIMRIALALPESTKTLMKPAEKGTAFRSLASLSHQPLPILTRTQLPSATCPNTACRIN
ncbi:hypothetical protein CY34DRAFT_808682 [Suillus luteus UH-Slu-Lm8-n1]|uniref:Uncharacterized protein n=1 Tax=Suillus luteus UH-Slu-Lm8-n1 TaxID=930992 RepID=A0A0D0B5H8_9AGAM|nr:hypothetical protein CY34DRAFT_808682 [Suillus luteus UH-Slu-Lm8-n1]